MTGLARRLRPSGPVIDAAAASRLLELLTDAADAQGWSEDLKAAWPTLAPIAAASPYLAGLIRRSPQRLGALLADDPDAALERVLAGADQVARETPPVDLAKKRLRELKAEAHLLTALCDVGGVWKLDAVTGALSRFADAACRAALSVTAAVERSKGRLTAPADPDNPIPGLFALAMGKHGAFELNYSSDVDVTFFYEPGALMIEGVEAQAFVNRCAQSFVSLLSERTVEGYVFRVDLRLRPDPSATPPVVSAPAALQYYETVGQNWERAAFIKARAAVGDLERGRAFLAELRPFVWRRSLDYAAVADIHSIKRQIHVFKTDERLEAAGANLKLGVGGIREIEFFVQTQQLILGGRDPGLRSCRTLDALKALRDAGHVSPAAARDLAGAYDRLRAWEHRVQMLADEQTHVLPEDAERRRAVAALSGRLGLERFDARVERTLRTVNGRYGELFAEEEALSSRFGSLVFTGVEDDPATLETLSRMGFSNPSGISATIRGWHHGRIPATRTPRGRELFTRLAPRLLDAAQATGAPDAAFNRFAAFFSGLSAGVQVQSLFLAQPALFELLVEVLAVAPRLAATLARRPAAFDALLDPGFFAPPEAETIEAAVTAAARGVTGFEDAMNAVRRAYREQAFRIGLQVLSGSATADEAGRAYAGLADGCVRSLAPAALAETARLGGAFAGGEAAVVALGKLGSREMTARSDLDLMTLYAAEPGAVSEGKGWMGETWYGRFTQRLIAALSAPTAEGGLYEIDMQLRPSGAKGPVAVSLPAFEHYYAAEADTWEFLALTRARVVWATSDAFAERCRAAIEAALSRPRDRETVARDVRDMRALMERERPPSGLWDLKLSPGGQVDVEFVAQYLQITGAPLRPSTVEALQAARDAGALDARRAERLIAAWTLAQDLQQILRAALDDDAPPENEPEPFRKRLTRAGGARGARGDLEPLARKLARVRTHARKAFETVLQPATETRRRRV